MRLDSDRWVKGGHERGHILLALLSLGTVSIEWAVAFGRLAMPTNAKVESIAIKGKEVGEARDEVAKYLLTIPKKQRPKYLFFFGDDMIPQWDHLLRLWQGMEEGKWDVLSGLYFLKQEMAVPIIWRKGVPGWLKPDVHYTLGESVWVDICGMDFVLIKTSLLEKMEKAGCREFFKTGPSKMGKNYVLHTEDVFFCEKAREVGARVGVHTGVRVPHYNHHDGICY